MSRESFTSNGSASIRGESPSELATALLQDGQRLEPLRGQLARAGYLVFDEFVPATRAAAIRAAIEADLAAERPIEVDRRNLLGRQRFTTFNGSRAFALPALGPLAEQVRQLVSALTGRTYVLVPESEVALSVNIVQQGGTFTAHYDRNELTAILYLDEPKGGEFYMWPLYRRLWPGRTRFPIRVLQQLTDAITFPRLMRRVLGRRVCVEPRAGRLVLIWGARNLHGVAPLRGGTPRYSVQFAYDLPHVRHSPAAIAKYYGNESPRTRR